MYASNDFKKRRAADRRAAGLCVKCAQPSDLYECYDCQRNSQRKHIEFIRVRDGNQCEVCLHELPEEIGSDVHVHHVYPQVMGGTDDLPNLSLAHAKCNQSINDKWMYGSPELQEAYRDR